MRESWRSTLVAGVLVTFCQAQSGWTQLQPAVRPQSRAHIAMTYDLVHGTVVLFGGHSGFGDTWTWDGTN